MRHSQYRLLAAVCTLAALVFSSPASEAREPSLPELRRKLEFARSDAQISQALDTLTRRIGKHDDIKDHRSLGDWLGRFPKPRRDHPLVLQCRGWAYVSAKDGEAALAPLQQAFEKNPRLGPTRAYLGEALRMTGKLDEAARLFPTAVQAGYDEPHLQQSVVETALAIRRRDLGSVPDELPAYAEALAAWTGVRPDPEADALLGQWLLEDLDAYEKPTTPRGRMWATTAADAIQRALDAARNQVQGGAILAFRAAKAIQEYDRDVEGRSPHFDLLVWSVRLGTEGGAVHPRPEVYVLLASAAAREGRYTLAREMVRRRMDISHSERAARILRTLPPDLID